MARAPLAKIERRQAPMVIVAGQADTGPRR
jgi:hypothetical protein